MVFIKVDLYKWSGVILLTGPKIAHFIHCLKIIMGFMVNNLYLNRYC